MSLYRIAADRFEAVPVTTFAAEKLMERKDIQRLLRADIAPLGDDLLVIAEEFGDWEDSNRRIDLLCVSREGDLVVVEIKRTESGGHMELQAVRYAAMVAGMTIERVTAAYAATMGVDTSEARALLATFLGADGDAEFALSGEVRIVLVSADFSTEVTTTVLWLNRRDLDIRCVRLRPYRVGNDTLIDATQIIPLPEAADYEVKQREQAQAKRRAEREKWATCRAFWEAFLPRAAARTSIFAGRSATASAVLGAGMGRGGFALNIVLEQDDVRVELFFRGGWDERLNEAVFQRVTVHRAEYEAAFGGPLVWDDRAGRLGWKIYAPFRGGWRSPEAEWPALHDTLIGAAIRLEQALRVPILEAANEVSVQGS